MTIDAYAHCGREKYLPVEALEGVMSETGVDCAVLCQHLGQFDNSYLASLLRLEPRRFAGVALVDHRDPGWEETLADVRRLGFRGVRVTSEALRENPGLSKAAATAGLHQILYAPEGIAAVVGPLRELSSTHPQAAFVVSHLGSPAVEDGGLRRGKELLTLADLAERLCAALRSCHVLFLSLCRPRRAGHDVIEAFGPERVMWGSNFPVGGDAASDYLGELRIVDPVNAGGSTWTPPQRSATRLQGGCGSNE